MAILSELWTSETDEGETKNTYQYIIDLQDCLETTCQLALQEIKKSMNNIEHSTTREPDHVHTVKEMKSYFFLQMQTSS